MSKQKLIDRIERLQERQQTLGDENAAARWRQGELELQIKELQESLDERRQQLKDHLDKNRKKFTDEGFINMQIAGLRERLETIDKGINVGGVRVPFNPEKYKTAAGAAKGFHKALCELAKKMGYNPDIEIFLAEPKDARNPHGNAWCVMWESGPFEWGITASYTLRSDRWFTEPYYSFDVGFIQE